MKLIHCADLHLDSAMETSLTPTQAKQRRQELLATFDRLLEYAKQMDVRAVLIAGDLFDADRVSPRTAALVLDIVRRAPTVDVLYLRGNHDTAGFGGLPLPENLHLFGANWTSFTYGNVTITGAERPDYAALQLPEDGVQIVVLHGPLGPGGVELPKLRGQHIRYLALGHLHSCQSGRLDADGDYAYPGCLEGRGFDECGEKGFLLLEIAQGVLTWQFVPFASRKLYTVTLDVTGGMGAVVQAAEALDIAETDLVKLVLVGACAPEEKPDADFLRARLATRFFALRVEDATTLALPTADWEGDISLRGELIRQVAAADYSEAEKERILRCALQALAGEAISL